MADDSLEVEKDILPFHPCSTPRGMTWFDLLVLTPLQQKCLNELKVATIKENNQYLARHPEIRALISLFVRSVLRDKKLGTPMHIQAMKFFTRPKALLEREVKKYLEERGEPRKKEGDSAVNIAQSKSQPTDEESKSSYQGLYTYLSYTDTKGTPEWEPDWESCEMEDFGMTSFEASVNYPDVASYLHETIAESATELDTNNAKITDDHELDFLFAPRDVSLVTNSRKSMCESIEESTISMAKLLLAPSNSRTESEYTVETDTSNASKSQETITSKSMTEMLNIILDNVFKDT